MSNRHLFVRFVRGAVPRGAASLSLERDDGGQ